MPIIHVAVGVPGTGLGVDLRYARQSPREKEADTAIEIMEENARQRASGLAIDRTAGNLARLLTEPSPLDRFTQASHHGLGAIGDEPDADG